MNAASEDAQPVILLCATMWWPLSARLAVAFLRQGCAVSAVCPPGHPLRFVSGMKRLYPYRGTDSLRCLRSAIACSKPSLIVPCDDGVVWQLHDLHARQPELRVLIEQSLGAEEAYPLIRSRGNFLKAAARLNIRVPLTTPVCREADLEPCSADAPAVLKLDGTWGGSGVAIARSPEEARTILRKFLQPAGAILAWKRWLINHDPLALWSWRKREAPSITSQQYIPGRPANTMFACRHGQVVGIVSVEVLRAQGVTGAATVVRLVRNEEMEGAARLIAAKFQLNGFHGLDFVIEAATGLPYLIELNPRCTQLGHLRIPGQGDLVSAICATLERQPADIPGDCLEGETIAFFPQTFIWNPQSEYLRHGYHDVPWNEPALLRELLREPWPERRWLTRLYHSLRTVSIPEEVKF